MPRVLVFVFFAGALLNLLVGCGDDGGTTVEDVVDAAQDAQADSGASDTALDAADAALDSGSDSAVPTDSSPGDTVADTSGAVCGNRGLEPGEGCDDGNTAPGDGCDAYCQLEPGFACPAIGAPCVECGDGALGTGEACDDGNRDAGDGCGATCQKEPGFNCTVPGTRCAPCGDGVVDPVEACDDGDRGGGDGCAADCLATEPGYVCPTPGSACVAERCGDGLRAGGEGCDDGNRLSGDGCSFLCALESGWVCDTPGAACWQAVCGNGAVEAQEQCDDGDTDPADGCGATCRLEPGYACATPGTACTTTACGDSQVEGLETCDDGNASPGDGCDAGCALEPGFACPTPGLSCVTTVCGDGFALGLEACDDSNTTDGDGCSAGCAVEPLYVCAGTPSACKLIVEFVSIARFPAPTPQTQSVHYDPATRTFVVYGFSSGDGVEFCLDGTVVGSRPRPVGDRLDGATYDPFTDRFLFVQQNNVLTEVDRAGAIARQVTLTGVNFAGGIAVGDNGRLYLSGQADHLIHIFERYGTAPIASIPSGTGQTWFDQMIAISGTGLIGAHFRPANDPAYHLTLWDLDGNYQDRSTIPGKLFRSGVGDFTNALNSNSDGAEAAVDGGAFMICSEYDGVCELFARTCETDAECAARIPQTACKLDETIPYCYAPTAARDDRYTVPSGPTTHNLDVGRNDLSSVAACTSSTPGLVSVSAGDQGGAIAIAADGTTLDYTPAAGFCDGVESFTYETDLGAGQVGTAKVEVFVNCTCGDGSVGGAEACDDGNTTSGDGCQSDCQVQSGWVCTGEPSTCTPNN